jgi:hypothetical protein
MIVNRGALPPIFWSSLSLSKSLGSKAILLPPSNADPACCDEATAVGLDVLLPLLPGPLGALGEPFDIVGPPSTSAPDVDEPAGTLRRDNPPFEVISSKNLLYK